jgi:hypothetical protein
MPRPSRRDPYTFPADAKIPEEGTYAEPDPNAGHLFNTMGNPASPPPLPDSQPPGSPVPVNFNTFPKTEFTGEPPPKPERTLLRKEKERKTSMNEPPPPPPAKPPSLEESYDHINTGRKWKASDRDRQNNIINGENGGPQEMNVYSHLENNDYSHAVFTPKTTPVKDNVYDTTERV